MEGMIHMKPIDLERVQQILTNSIGKDVYVHLETTNGAYASHFNNEAVNVGAYIRNARISFSQAKIVQDDASFRVGLKMDFGWVYAEGLSDFEEFNGALLLAGHDAEGRVMVSLQISDQPFAQEIVE